MNYELKSSKYFAVFNSTRLCIHISPHTTSTIIMKQTRSEISWKLSWAANFPLNSWVEHVAYFQYDSDACVFRVWRHWSTDHTHVRGREKSKHHYLTLGQLSASGSWLQSAILPLCVASWCGALSHSHYMNTSFTTFWCRWSTLEALVILIKILRKSWAELHKGAYIKMLLFAPIMWILFYTFAQTTNM